MYQFVLVFNPFMPSGNKRLNIFEQIYSPAPLLTALQIQCGFRQSFSTQYCLIAMIEKWKRNLDKGGSCGALLIDLSKAFDYST